MSHANYMKASGIIFLALAILHLWRIMNEIPVRFGSATIPMWASWAAVIIGGYLAYHALKKR